MKEIVNIRVRVEIEYDENEKGSRREAIIKAKDNVTSVSTYGCTISAKPLTAKILK